MATTAELRPNALDVLRARYLLKDDTGQIVESPEGMFRRVAQHVASVEDLYGGRPDEVENRFFEVLSRLEFLPSSPALMNAGAPLGQLAACFVLPVEDSLESIFGAVRDSALIHQTGGGVGYDFSRIRPRGDTVATTGGPASGPLSFMRVFDTAVEAIRQGGRDDPTPELGAITATNPCGEVPLLPYTAREIEPECGGRLHFAESTAHCRACGYSPT